MNNRPECLPCCLRRVLRTAEKSTPDEWLHRKILAEAMQELARVDDKATPAEVIHTVSRRVGKTLGVSDPYAEEKRIWLGDTLANRDWIESAVKGSEDPLLAALHLSAAANILDWELRHEIVSKNFSLRTLVEGYASVPFVRECLEEFRTAVAGAQKVMFVHATAGELAFDRILIELFGKPREAVFSVVRDHPILAHATAEDARRAELELTGEIVTPGTDCLGIPLHFCSAEFREHYRTADLVVAKGQACFETLEGKEARVEGEEEREVFFLLRVKCALVARHLGASVGDCVLEVG